jgi:hypothetical protein
VAKSSPSHRSILVLEYVIWFLRWHGRARLLYSARVLSEKERGREALNLRGYYLSVRHVAWYKAYSQSERWMLWAFLGQSRRVGGFIYLKPYRTMASRIPVNSPQITFPQLPLFSFYSECQNNLAPVQQVLYQITSDRFSVCSQASEVLALDIILYLNFFFSLLFVPVTSYIPSTLERCVPCWKSVREVCVCPCLSVLCCGSQALRWYFPEFKVFV